MNDIDNGRERATPRAALRRYARAVRAWAEHVAVLRAAGYDWTSHALVQADLEYEAADAAVLRWLAAPIRRRAFRRAGLA